jgi:hypothetical protein
MANIYGPGLVYAPRAHTATSQWVSQDPSLLDYMSGNQQTVLGEMPYITSEATACPAGLELIAEAGLEPAQPTGTFKTEEQAIEKTRDSLTAGRRLVIQHLLPPSLFSEESFWVRPALLSYLNNKANLPDFASASQIPSRCLSSATAAFRRFPKRPFPFVLKVATELSTGAGCGVAVCRNDDDLAPAAIRFGSCANLIIESFVPIRQNICVNHAVMPDGSIRYLGHAAQHVSETGQYIGNWIALGEELPPTFVEIAAKITRKAAALGYRGISGIDIALLDDERPMVLDLNFRVNGSTATVLFAPALLKNFGPVITHLRTFTAADGFEKMIATARSHVRRGHLIPLNTFNPAATNYAQSPARLAALVIASTKSEIEAIECELASQGLS